MKYLLFMFMPLVFIASWVLEADFLNTIAYFFIGGFLGYCAARFLSD
ncbi:MAG: hypothetical protein IJP85_05755 [Synergistaceae bacterium]|nr:hypothetical protein [Synergistaceae bacterium]